MCKKFIKCYLSFVAAKDEGLISYDLISELMVFKYWNNYSMIGI